MPSEDALDLSNLSAQAPSEDRVLNCFGFSLVHFVIFQENQGLGILRMWVQVTQSWLHWPVTYTLQRAPTLRRDPTSALPVLI